MAVTLYNPTPAGFQHLDTWPPVMFLALGGHGPEATAQRSRRGGRAGAPRQEGSRGCCPREEDEKTSS